MNYICNITPQNAHALIKMIDDGSLVKSIKSIISSVFAFDTLDKLEEQGKAQMQYEAIIANKLVDEAVYFGAACFIHTFQDREFIEKVANEVIKRSAKSKNPPSFIIIYNMSGAENRIQKIIDMRSPPSSEKLSKADAQLMLYDWFTKLTEATKTPPQQD